MKVEIIKNLGHSIQYVEDGKKDIQTAELEEWVKTEYVQMGIAEISVKDGKVTFCTMEVKQENVPSEMKKSSAGQSTNSDMVTFETLLTAAHKKAKDAKHILSIKTGVIKGKDKQVVIDVEKKFVMFKARIVITDKDGPVCSFDGIGDTLESNVDGTTAKHWIRIAETRAIVRALKLYTNNATCSEEEK